MTNLCPCAGFDPADSPYACADCGHEDGEHDNAGICRVDMSPWDEDGD
jgi:hypothetical protein